MAIVTHGPITLESVNETTDNELPAWSGKTTDGRTVFITYENRNFIVMISKDVTDSIDAAKEGNILMHQILQYNTLDMTLLKKITRRRITFPN
jgi:hypothetical protein